MKYYCLFIENSLTYPIQDDLNKFFDYLKRKLGITVFPEYISVKLDNKFKDFGVKVNGISYHGLSGIKEELRNTGKIIPQYYHSIFYLYDKGKFNEPLAAWTYPNTLEGATFSEIPCTEEWERQDDLFRMLTHEIMHQLFRLAWDKKVYLKDEMDSYLKEFEPEALDGNRAIAIKTLTPHLDKILEEPRNRTYKSLLEFLVEKLTQLRDLLLKNREESKTLLDRFCLAIQKYEGFYPGSRSYRNNNPGNLYYASQQGTVGRDEKGFAVFDTYGNGYKALKNQIRLAISGKSKYYKPDMSIIDFFSVYAPYHDSNDPYSYALFVARETGLDPQTKIKDLA